MVSLYIDWTTKTIPVTNHANDVPLVIHRTLRITGTEPLSLGSAPRTPRSPVDPMVRRFSGCVKA